MTKSNSIKNWNLSRSACMTAVAIAASLFATSSSFAALNFTFFETSSGVTLRGEGDFNLEGLDGPTSVPRPGGFVHAPTALGVGPAALVDQYRVDLGAFGDQPIDKPEITLPGAGGGNVVGFPTGGDVFGVDTSGTDAIIYLPQGYESGTPLSGTVEFPGQTFESLGLSLGGGGVGWGTIGSDFGGNSIHYEVSAVPEPGTFLALAPAFVGLFFLRKRNG